MMLKLIACGIALIICVRFLFRRFLNLPHVKAGFHFSHKGIDNLMNENDFWDIIEHTRKFSKRNYRMQCDVLTEYLSSLPSNEIIQFNRTFQLLMAESYSSKLWEAAYALNGGCSDDCFEYFRTWLIAQGKANFYTVVHYPRAMFFICVKELLSNYEGFAYCSYQAYMNRTGSGLPPTNGIEYKELGEAFNENTAFLRYPELALLAW